MPCMMHAAKPKTDNNRRATMTDVTPTRPFPPNLASENIKSLPEDELIDLTWSELALNDLDKPFQLPDFKRCFDSVSSFVETELKVQLEVLRSEIHLKVKRNSNLPKETEKHIHFPLPHGAGDSKQLHLHDLSVMHKQPPRGQFTNYVVILQREGSDGLSMENLTLAYTKYMRKKDGAHFALGKDYERLRNVHSGTLIYMRVLKNTSMLKTHLRAIAALVQAEHALRDSYVTKKLLEGRINDKDIRSDEELDQWIHAKTGSTDALDLSQFNPQQQRALALESLTSKGVVLIQGPPGTGKSHTICHGILPQVVQRKEKVLLVCNSNVAVDALMLKCTKIDKLQGRIIRCGFKSSVSDEIVDLGLYAEGDGLARAIDQYGNLPGSNSNTADANVQEQIRSKQVVFTTIHFASKEKARATSDADMYWNFETLVLDEAAQIEDSRLFIVLARCPTLKKIVLVGDPKQIQPYVPDSLRRQNYGQSTMERLMGSGEAADETTSGASYVMLEQQFRMAPLLRQIVSNLYYNNRLIDGPNVASRGPKENLKLKPLLVVNLTGTKCRFSLLHQSYENDAEAAVCQEIYDFLFSSEFNNVIPALGESSLSANDVCILTPFNRHKDRLRMTICDVDEDDLDAYSGQTFGRGASRLGSTGGMGSPSRSTLGSPSKGQVLFGTQDEVSPEQAAMVASIDTVDKFQGSERKIVIISTCVDHKPLRAADPHFINVASSRAQHLLIVVGNFTDALACNRDWSDLWTRSKNIGSYIEHSVVFNDDKDNPVPDIRKEDLKSKLRELVRGRNKREREDGILE